MPSFKVSEKLLFSSKTKKDLDGIEITHGELVANEQNKQYVKNMNISYCDKYANHHRVIFITKELYFDGGIPFYKDYRGKCFYIKNKEDSKELFTFIKSLDETLKKKKKYFLEEDDSKTYQTKKYKPMIENDSIRVYYKMSGDDLKTSVMGKGVNKYVSALKDLREHFRIGVKCRLALQFESIKVTNLDPENDFDDCISHVIVRCLQIKIIGKAEELKPVDYFENESDNDDEEEEEESDEK